MSEMKSLSPAERIVLEDASTRPVGECPFRKEKARLLGQGLLDRSPYTASLGHHAGFHVLRITRAGIEALEAGNV